MNHHLKIFLYLILFCFIHKGVLAQIFPENSFKHLTMDDGLSNNFVDGFIKDRRGYIWIIGDKPNRYDGYDIFPYNEIEGNPTSFLGSTKHICLDAEGELWFLSSKGVLKYNEETDGFTRYLKYKSKNGTDHPIENYNTMLLDTDGSFLIYGFSPNVLKLNPVSGEIIETSLPASPDLEKGIRIGEIVIDKNKVLWYSLIGRPKLIKCVENKEPVIIDLGEILGAPNFTISKMEDDFKSENLIIYGRGELDISNTSQQKSFILLNKENLSIKKIESYKGKNSDEVDQTIWSILPYDKNVFFFGYKENLGVGAMDINTGVFQHAISDINYSGSLSHNNIFNLYRSSDNIIWVGTQMGGANILDLNQKHFKHFKKEGFNLKQSLSHDIVLDFIEGRDENIWIGTDKGGLNKFNLATEKFTHYMHDEKNKNSLSANAALSLAMTKDGIIWIGTWNGGLNRFNPSTGTFKSYIPKEDNANGLSCKNVWQVTVSEDDQIWVGYQWCNNSKAAFSLFDPVTEKFTHFSHDPNDKNTPPTNSVEALYADPLNNLWGSISESSNNYVFKYDIDQNKFTHFNLPDSTKFNYHRVNCFLMEEEGKYWMGTEGGGLILFDEETTTFERFTVSSHGLSSDFIQSIEKDSDGKLWMGTSNGLLSFSPKTLETSSFGVRDGMQGKGFKKGSLFTKRGDMFFGGSKGFNMFNPKAIIKNNNVPPIYITKFSLFNKESDFQDEASPLNSHISTTKELTLTHEQNIFSFELTALNFTNPSQNQYAYYMEGLENDWNYVGNQRNAAYTNLDPGVYTFHAKASNNDGIWNTEGTSLKITILPPWWETWWFRIIASVLFLGSGIVFYLYRTHALKKQQAILEQKVEERTYELSKAAEEIRTQNEELHQQSEELQQQRDYLQDANNTITETNEELQTQKEELSHKNDQITSSINYALRIQKAILPSKGELDKSLNNYFIIFRPKDVVSGDFYWSQQIGNKVLVAAVDCTGHGVPGAFMSMIGSSLLNRIVLEMKVDSPADILKILDKLIIRSLRQDTSDNKDGMDMVICSIEQQGEEAEVIMSGAKNSLYYFSQETQGIERLKGDRFGIGGIRSGKKVFTNQKVKLKKGSSLYLLTDGLVDQNASSRLRFGSKRLISSLENCIGKPSVTQQHVLENDLDNYMKGERQRDDITVIGINI